MFLVNPWVILDHSSKKKRKKEIQDIQNAVPACVCVHVWWGIEGMFIVECFLFFLREAGVDVPTVLTPRLDRRGGTGHARVVCPPS